MREVISVHVGQAGVQIGNACWELYCLEHGIEPDGQLKEKDKTARGTNGNPHSIFSECQGGNFVSRSLMIDHDPDPIDDILLSEFRDLHSRSHLVKGRGSAADVFHVGTNMAKDGFLTNSAVPSKSSDYYLIDGLRKLAEACSSLHGIVFNSAIGGGTGSGVPYWLGYTTETEYSKIEKTWHTIVPSPQLSGSVVEPYNSILAIHEAAEYFDSVVMMDNFALHRIMRQSLNNESPRFSNINRITAQVIAAQTGALRFGHLSGIDLRDFHTNMVPYPRIKFLTASMAPFLPRDIGTLQDQSAASITQALFENSSFTIEANHRAATLLSSSILYKGDYSPLDLVSAVDMIRSDKRRLMPEWLLTGFKIGLDARPRVDHPRFDLADSWRSAISFSNSTACAEVFDRILNLSEGMYYKRAFCHHFMNQGWKMGETFRSRYEVAGLVNDYKEVCRVATNEENNAENDDQDQD